MRKRLFSTISMLLAVVTLFNMLPLSVFAASSGDDSTPSTTQDAAEDASIVAELPEKRTEFSKEYRLSNGLHMISVYAEAVHYQKDGQWKEIDNTLKATGSGSSAALTNTEGVWDVQFPQVLSKDKAVTVTKDGYTLSFHLAGELRGGNSELQTASATKVQAETFAIGGETFRVESAKEVNAQVEKIDLTAEKAQVRYPETVSAKNHSRLQYAQVYTNTDVVYDLASNQVKESIVIGAYDAARRGYRYTLNTGKLIPVLDDSGEIRLYDEQKKNVVLVMPAPYLMDDAGDFCDDVTVGLTGAKGTYTLTYTLPQSWMADKARQYPVILDPIVSPESSENNLSDVSVYQIDPYPHTNTLLDVGQRPENGNMRSFVKFLNLPEIPKYNTIVNATFSLYHKAPETSAIAVCAHKVLDTWEESTMTWDNQPAHDPSVDDYCLVDAAGDYDWNVTEIVRGWYEGENTGLILRGTDFVESNTANRCYRHRFHAENYSQYHRATLNISYRSAFGVEPYYTYATLGAGNAGGVYLSDSTGQITAFREVASYASTVNPFSMNLVYNSMYFSESDADTFLPPAQLGLDMSLGQGWTLDAIQRIAPVELDGTVYLKYSDGDGSEHYFTLSSGVYYDEDGLGLEIVAESDGSYTMSDDQDNRWFFTALEEETTACFLTAMEDNDGNRYALTYENLRLTQICQLNNDKTQTVVAQLTYTGNELTQITDASGQSTNLAYDEGGKLVQISRNTDVLARYAYDGNRLTTLTDVQTGYALCMTYNTDHRVSSYYEQSGDNRGVQCDISYPSVSHTVYHDYGVDREKGSPDDLYTHYLFDYAGRTVNVYTTDISEKNILGASNALYTDNDGISKQNNRTLRTASIGVAAQKLLTQGSFESSSDEWTYSGTDAKKSRPRTGLYSLRGIMSAETAVGSASRTTMTLTQGQVYTLSAYVHTAAVTSLTGDGVWMELAESNDTVHISEAVDHITDSTVEKGWERIALTFTATCTGTATVSIYGTGIVGTFYVDDVQLEQGEAPSNYNMLENGDFQVGNSYGWTAKDEYGSIVTGVGVHSTEPSASAAQIIGKEEEKYSIVYQNVNVNLTGETYVLSGWAKADAVPDNITVRSSPAYDHSKQFGLRVTITFSDDSHDYFYTPFNTDVTDWQFASLAVTPSASKTVSVITVSCVYETNSNVALFDNISLVRETVQSTTYDANGKPTSSSTTGLNKQTVTYDANGNVKTVVNKTGTGSSDKITTTYTYDSTFVHRVTEVSNGTTKQAMTYDGVGNVTQTAHQAKSGSGKKILSSTGYDSQGDRVTSVTDAAGNTTTYDYGTALSRTWAMPTSVTTPNGTTHTTSYDNLGRVTQNSVANTASVLYNYSNGMLASIQRGIPGSTQTYRLEYDAFGNTEKISIAAGTESMDLITNSYGNKNGLLTQQTYANGDTVSYTYDKLGRVKTTTYSDGRVLTYRYTGDGQLYDVTDSKTGYTYQYSYDTLGRLLTSKVSDSSGAILSTRQTYDANNQLTGQFWNMGEDAYSELYTYSKTTGLLATHTPAVGNKLTFSYDTLQRLSTITGGLYTKTYTYRDVGDNTTNQVSGITYDLPTDVSVGYTYDAMGNIATYTQGDTTYTYTYDAQGQLLSQTGGSKTYTYTYDAAGNIRSASDGTTTKSYTYGHGVWKDLLTSFNGQSITYDENGNPTRYLFNTWPYTLTWEEGNRLVSATNGPSTYTFTYDSEGLMTSKTKGTTTHRYYYAGGKLLKETYDNTVLEFFYDANGHPYAMKRNGYLFYYITNLQGDVIQLTDASGNVLASYTYDPYGNATVTTPSSTQVIGYINPLRYRGYYLDTELGLYYLQSRFYDPATGRFISADAYASTGQGIIGHNMFAYCGNNPISRADAAGNAWYGTNTVAINDGGSKPNDNPFFWNDPSRPYYARISEDEARNAAIRILGEYSFVNYKGAWVFKIPFMYDKAFSFGCIFIGSYYQYDEEGRDTLDHEYGHYVQFSQIGLVDYTTKIAIPSLKGYWSNVPYWEYYSQPWEYLADLFGDVDRDGYVYAADAHEKAMAYWEAIING